MKYLKTFESITNSIFNIAPFQKYFGLTPDEFEDYFVGMVDDLNLNAKVMWDRGINAATVIKKLPNWGIKKTYSKSLPHIFSTYFFAINLANRSSSIILSISNSLSSSFLEFSSSIVARTTSAIPKKLNL